MMRASARVLTLPLEALEARRGHLFPFVPICLAVGIGLYFALPREPAPGEWAALAVAVPALAILALRGPEPARILATAMAVMLAGVGLAGQRAHVVAAPVLDRHFYGAIEGRIVVIDRSQSDAPRLTLDRVVLEGMEPAQTPARVRVAMHGTQGFIEPEAGLRVILTGHLSPPPGPVEPGGFDFRRLAWFQGLGAVGYTRTPVLAFAPPRPDGLRQAITRLRLAISGAVQARMAPETGAFAAAILTGDRAGIDRATLEALRASNLAHLLAISGLHMGLLTGLVFAATRCGLALVPAVGLRLHGKKVAAVVALAAAAFYLALSGGNVATERAFIMVAVMLGAVLADRRAISLRSVALAATAILIMRPESLLEAGFQMSFAATAALVATFAWLRDEGAWQRLPRPLRPVTALFVCSVVAGLATAPVAAAQFNRLAEYGLLANLLSVPLMGSVVMPAALLAAALAPLGLASAGLWVMDLGIRWILWVARWVAGFEGAVMAVVQPPGWVLPAMALGAAFFVLWQGRARLTGVAVAVLAIAAWGQAERPLLLVADSGTLVGLLTPEGRVISKPSGEGFVARNWLEADGDPATQAAAHARPGFEGPAGARSFAAGGMQAVHLTGRGAAARLDDHCRPGVLVILGARAPEAGQARDCILFDAGLLGRSGTLALFADPGGGLRVSSAAGAAGLRPWTMPDRLGRSAPAVPVRLPADADARVAAGPVQ